MIKDNSGYRASPRRIENLVGNRDKVEKPPVSPKNSKSLNSTPQSSKKAKSPSTPKSNSKSKLTKSTVKVRPTKTFYGAAAAKTPKGSKRKASISKEDAPKPKKSKVSSPVKSITPKKSESPAKALKLTKSTVKNKKINSFYGKNVAKTPKGAKPQKTPLSRNTPRQKELSTPKGSFSEIRLYDILTPNIYYIYHKRIYINRY